MPFSNIWSAAKGDAYLLGTRNADYANFTTSVTEKYGSYYKLICALTDLALINLSGWMAYLVIYWPKDALNSNRVSMLHILLINFIWFNVTQLNHLYKDIFAKDAIPTIKQSLYSLVLFGVLMSCLAYWVPDFHVQKRLIFYTVAFFAPLFIAGKIGFLLLRISHRANLIDYTRIVIVGAGPVGIELGRIIESRPHMGYRLAGYFDDKPGLRGEGSEDMRILGNISDCIAYVKKYNIREVYCALPDRAIEKINRLMREADREMIRFKLVPDVKDYFRKDVNVKMLGHFPVISPRVEPLENATNMMLKRIFDLAFSFVALVFVISWMLPLVALLIKLESKGPVFFKQLRSGKNNQPFYCLKFRSMYVNDDAHLKQASKNDRRITRVGAFIRKTSIDELPQFFNVIMGQMSVVGPRPHMLQHTEEYSALIDKFMVRHFLLPGITGWAQVNGHRGETHEAGAMEARVAADIWYLENWSMFLDLKIVFLTVWQVVFGHENAY